MLGRSVVPEEGIRFECQRCCACCMGEPGYVWAGEGEVEEMARFLGMGIDAFSRSYLRSVAGRSSLKEVEEGRCILLGEEGCLVYPVRPLQCRTFPFWKENLVSPEAWRSMAETCPGIGKGRWYSPGEIQAILSGRGEASGELNAR